MKIAGIEKNSFVDYPRHLSCVVFTQGCNMNCFYCHNKPLIGNGEIRNISCKEVLDFLLKRQKFIDAVVISGENLQCKRILRILLKMLRK